MRLLRSAATTVLLLLTAAWTTPKTITLSVPGMTCSTCPITIRKALERVKGVANVEVSYEKLEAVVTFDDAITNVEALISATTRAGYPSVVRQPPPRGSR